MEIGKRNQMTVAELLLAWDSGECIPSISLGGFGPGYEQAIQVLAVEIVRDNIGKPLPQDDKGWHGWGDSTVSRIDYKLPNGKWSMGGFSGAQVGAAKQLAYRWLNIGPDAVREAVPTDRWILVSNFWPKVGA